MSQVGLPTLACGQTAILPMVNTAVPPAADLLRAGVSTVPGWHSRVKTLAGKAHLNIFDLVELFKTELSNMEASILQLASGGTLKSIVSINNSTAGLLIVYQIQKCWPLKARG